MSRRCWYFVKGWSSHQGDINDKDSENENGDGDDDDDGGGGGGGGDCRGGWYSIQ